MHIGRGRKIIDRTAEHRTAELGALRAAIDLHTTHVNQLRDRLLSQHRHAVIERGDFLAIGRDLGGLHTTDAGQRTIALTGLGVLKAWHRGGQRAQIGDAGFFQSICADTGDGDRHIDQSFLALTRNNDDFFQSAC